MDSHDSLKNYHVIRKLGHGAFGDVYEARNSRSTSSSESHVAVKIILKESLNTQTRRRRLAREVTLHSSLRQHPSLLTLYNYFEDSTRVFIVTELCPHGNLHRYLSDFPNGLPDNKVRRVITDIVEGLQQLHTLGIIHRDLKLSNILIDKSMHVKIADFGLARIIDDSKTEAFTFCGTPNYISPEILARRPYGLESDIWSLGCIFLTLLTGKPPFAGVGIEDILDRVVKGEYEIPKCISRNARRLGRVMLESDPLFRISTFEILKHEFFDGPVSMLSMPDYSSSNGISIDEEMLMDHNENILPTRIPAPKRRSECHESQRDGMKKGSWDKQRPTRVGSAKQQVGLATLLEEIGVSEDYPRKSSSPDHAKDGRRWSSQLSGDVRGQTSVETRRDRRRSQDARRGTSVETLENIHRVSNRSDESVDSQFREKEAVYNQYETEYNERRNQSRQPRGVSKPSPGEGLRNALGNLETRLKTRTFGTSRQSSVNQQKEDSESKGFATMVEELVKPRTRRAEKENVLYPKERRSVEIQKGLLSLLSNLNDSNKSKTSHPPERQQSSRDHPQPSNPFTLLPTAKTSIDTPDFATKYAFTTKGITPLTQHTKHGVVKVTSNGHIELHLPSISHNIFTISPDGKQISVNDSRNLIWRGNVQELPWRWTRIYRYASRFVSICRSRIPRVSVQIDGLRGRIMLNGEFEVWNALQSLLLRITLDCQHVKIISVEEEMERVCWKGNVDLVPRVWRDSLRSAKSLYRKCLSLAADDDVTARCVPGVGWCTKRGETIQLLFEDGVRMDVDHSEGILVYCDERRNKERWRFNDGDLPRYICERLQRCDVFRDVE